jgi:hypothetical protein
MTEHFSHRKSVGRRIIQQTTKKLMDAVSSPLPVL